MRLRYVVKNTGDDGAVWLARHDNPFPTVVADPVGSAGPDWRVYGAPETFVLDAAGTIVNKQIGPMNETVRRERIASLMVRP